MPDNSIIYVSSKDTDILTIKYRKAAEGDVIDAMVEAGYGNEFPIQANEYMFTDDKERPDGRIFSMMVKHGDAQLKATLDSYSKSFDDVRCEPWQEPTLTPEASAAAVLRLRAKGYDI